MKRIISYPLLLVAAIIFERVAISSDLVGIEQSLRALVVCLLMIILSRYAVQYLKKDWHYTDFIVVMIPIALLAYRWLYRFLKLSFPNREDFLGYTLIFLLGALYAVIVSRKVWGSIRQPARISAYFSVVFALLLGFQVVRLIRDGYKTLVSTNPSETADLHAANTSLHLESKNSPDIYVIILDGYTRQDVLQTIYEYDNSEFVGWLEQQGFYVASDSHSNYTETVYTVASLWNFNYLQPWNSAAAYRQYLLEPIQDNRVFQLLDEIGYTTVSFEGALTYIQIKDADVYLSNFAQLNHFETMLLVDSPLEPLSNTFNLRLPLYTYQTHRQRTLYQLEMLKEIPADIPGPKVVYAHIMAPHPPFLFHADGSASQPYRPYTLREGIGCENCEDKYRDGYREQVQYLNSQMVEVIHAILTRSAAPPVIVVMSDHGPASMFRQKFDAPGCLWERTSNLYAIFLPGPQEETVLHASITPVNTFRIVFNTYFAADLPLLEDKTYLADWKQPQSHMDVTSRSNSPVGCTAPGQ